MPATAAPDSSLLSYESLSLCLMNSLLLLLLRCCVTAEHLVTIRTLQTHTRTCTHMHPHTHSHSHTRTRTHTSTPTHTHTQKAQKKRGLGSGLSVTSLSWPFLDSQENRTCS